jgi:antirestriction protein
MPKIYVACIAAYNAGKLHGEWIDAAQDADDLEAAIQEMLKVSPIPNAEEWRIDDSEGFHGLEPPTNLEELSELAYTIEEHGEVYALWAGHVGLEYATAEGFTDKFIGSYENLAEYAETMLEELNELPADLRIYFDFQRFGEDLDRGGDITAIESGRQVHVFNPL